MQGFYSCTPHHRLTLLNFYTRTVHFHLHNTSTPTHFHTHTLLHPQHTLTLLTFHAHTLPLLLIYTSTIMCQSNSPTLGPSLAAKQVELQIAFELAAQAEVLPDKPTKYMSELIQKPRKRRVLLRHDKTLQFNRTTNKDAILAFTRGEVAVPSYTSCEAGAGPFTECINVKDMFKRSCSNCHYGSEGARCSFRPGKCLLF